MQTVQLQTYQLDVQIGYLLRRANQRHLSIFVDAIPDLTTTQFAALARLCEKGPLSQNLLGRETSMDAATVKGVVDRLRRAGLVDCAPDPTDKRRVTVSASAAGQELFARIAPLALEVSDRTLSPLSAAETRTLLDLLQRLA